MGFFWFFATLLLAKQWPWPVAGRSGGHPFFWLWERLQHACTGGSGARWLWEHFTAWMHSAEISTHDARCMMIVEWPARNGHNDSFSGLTPRLGVVHDDCRVPSPFFWLWKGLQRAHTSGCSAKNFNEPTVAIPTQFFNLLWKWCMIIVEFLIVRTFLHWLCINQEKIYQIIIKLNHDWFG